MRPPRAPGRHVERVEANPSIGVKFRRHPRGLCVRIPPVAQATAPRFCPASAGSFFPGRCTSVCWPRKPGNASMRMSSIRFNCSAVRVCLDGTCHIHHQPALGRLFHWRRTRRAPTHSPAGHAVEWRPAAVCYALPFPCAALARLVRAFSWKAPGATAARLPCDPLSGSLIGSLSPPRAGFFFGAPSPPPGSRPGRG